MKLPRHWALLFLLSLGLASGNAAPRIAIAGISHETNSFNLTKATLADFEGRGRAFGESEGMAGNKRENEPERRWNDRWRRKIRP